MDHSEKIRYRWLLGTSIITLILVVVYISTHLRCDGGKIEVVGNEINYLNLNQVNLINSTINNHDSTDDTLIKKSIIDYLQKENNINNSADIIKYINNTELSILQIYLPYYPIKTKSFFWLDGNRILLEIVFWSLFGLIANLLFSALSAQVFDQKKIPEQIGKFIYTPFLAIIIYLSIDLLSSSKTPAYESFGKGVIVLAFILGFYTRRAIVLLGRVKDLILPAKEREKKEGNDDDSKPNENNTNNIKKEEDLFKELSYDEQKRIINEFIKTEASQLKDKFDEIQGFSARKKEINNEEQPFYCLHIEIEEKKNNMDEAEEIPKQISFIESSGLKYTFQTDITGVGKNELSSPKTAKFIGENQNPKQLGLSCSRIGSKAMGTIGLMVYKNNEDKPYLLSCYHVLCSTELKAQKSKFTNDPAIDSKIISPGGMDTVEELQIPIAEVSDGTLSHHMDAALAKLNDKDLLQNVFYDYNGKVNGISYVSSVDIRNKRTVYLFGRTSGRRKGTIIDNNQGIVYLNGYPKDTLEKGELWNLIITSKISKPGDSGAAVVDSNNKVIGILVGSNQKHSFVIPISTIINKFNLNKNKLNN